MLTKNYKKPIKTLLFELSLKKMKKSILINSLNLIKRSCFFKKVEMYNN